MLLPTLSYLFSTVYRLLAERGGFEPPVELLTLQRFSKPPPSATRPSLLLSPDYTRSSTLLAVKPRKRWPGAPHSNAKAWLFQVSNGVVFRCENESAPGVFFA